MTKKHARNSPSSAYRWMSCPASLELSKKAPKQKTSIHAAEGTAAHAIAEDALKAIYNDGESLNLDLMLGRIMSVDGYEIEVTQEMIDSVNLYVTAITAKAPWPNGSESIKHVRIEESFELYWLHEDVSGTNDCCIYDEVHQTISILDFKYGKGLTVDPKWNPQLLIYALGALQQFTSEYALSPKGIKEIQLIVVQPRAYHTDGAIRSWSITPRELLFWAANVLRPAILETHSPNAKLCSGEHCRFCPALAICPEQLQNALEVAKTDFHRPTLPRPENMTPQELEKVMEVSEIISNWSKSVQEYVTHNMKNGSLRLPNYKLVEKKTVRKWKNEKLAEMELGLIFGEDIYKKKLNTPAQIEKLAKKANLNMNIKNLTEKPEGELTIAHNSDKRPSRNNNTIGDFIHTADFLQ